MAVTTDVIRGVVGVPGGPYSLLLPRSEDFTALGDILKIRYTNPLDRVILLSIMQILWDRADPGGYMGSITSNPLPNTPTHQVIVHHALGDRQVTYLGAYAIGRSINAQIFASNVHYDDELLYGFPVIPDTQIAYNSVLVTWDFAFLDCPEVPKINIPPPCKNDTHEGPRRQLDAQLMMLTFFATGNIVNTCNGPCHGSPF